MRGGMTKEGGDSDDPRARPDEPIASVARRALFLHLRRLEECEPGAQAGREPEALHDMRVAVRRIRVILLVFGQHLDGKEAQAVARELRSLGRTLGAVRDLDVLIGETRTSLGTHKSEDARGGLLTTLRLAGDRERALMLARLQNGKHTLLKRRIRLLASRPAKSPRAGNRHPVLVRDIAAEALRDRLAKVWGRLEQASKKPTPRQLHRLRIAGKRLRYTMEFLRGALGADTDDALRELRRAQDLLGRLQDAEMAMKRTQEAWRLVERAGGAPSTLAQERAYIRLRAREREMLLAAAPREALNLLGPSLGQLVTASLTAHRPRGGHTGDARSRVRGSRGG